MIAAQLGFRAWALYPALVLRRRLPADGRLRRRQTRLGLPALTPYDNQFMPIGRALVAAGGRGRAELDLRCDPHHARLQQLASLACLWMLITLFGRSVDRADPAAALPLVRDRSRRRHVVGRGAQPAAAAHRVLRFRRRLARARSYPSSSLAAADPGVPAFWSCGYVRRRSCSWSCSPSCRWPTSARAGRSARWPPRRTSLLPRYGVSRSARPRLPLLLRGPFPSFTTRPSGAARGRPTGPVHARHRLASGLIGGPWRWDDINPPVVGPAPPTWAVQLSWLAIALLVLDWRCVASAPAAGLAPAGRLRRRQLRAALHHPGDPGRRDRRPPVPLPHRRGPRGRALPGPGHDGAPGRRRVQPLRVPSPCSPRRAAGRAGRRRGGGRGGLRRGQLGPLRARLARRQPRRPVRPHGDRRDAWSRSRRPGRPAVLPTASSRLSSLPPTRPRRSCRSLVDNARFPESSSHLAVLDDGGTPRQALISAVAISPPGPVDNCGYPLTSSGLVRPPEQGHVGGAGMDAHRLPVSAADDLTLTLNGVRLVASTCCGAPTASTCT